MIARKMVLETVISALNVGGGGGGEGEREREAKILTKPKFWGWLWVLNKLVRLATCT